MTGTSRKRRKALPVILTFGAILALITFFGVWYFLQPCHIKNTDTIVDQATIEVFGAEYNSQQPITRQDAIYLISKVFHSLKRPGFGEIETLTQAIGQAVEIGLLQGSETGLNLEGYAKNQEILAFISRGLKLPLNTTETVPLPYQDATSISEWALSDISALTAGHYLDWIGTGALRPKEYATISEVRTILKHLVSKVTAPQSFWSFLCFEWENNKVIMILVFLLTAMLSFVFPIYDRARGVARATRHKSSIRGAICMAGSTGVGKTTFIAKLRNPSAPVLQLKREGTPTRGIHTEPIRLIADNGDVIFDGIVKDMSGEYPAGALQFLSGPDPNKVLMLVLAHTKDYKEAQIDDHFIDEQLEAIKRTWIPSLQAYGHFLQKLIIFVNKADLFTHESGDLQEYIFGRHISLLINAVNDKVPIHVIEGSSVKGTGFGELYRVLRPNI